jgi:glycosyltransferase involved in cell wall biosynthesis
MWGTLLEQISRSGLPVTLLGEVPCGPDFLGELDLACFPSRREGFGLAVGEALAQGVPVLLADILPFREVYGQLPEACFLSPSLPLRRQIHRVKALLHDRELRRRVDAQGKIILARHALSQVSVRYQDFYRRLVQQLAPTSATP